MNPVCRAIFGKKDEVSKLKWLFSSLVTLIEDVAHKIQMAIWRGVGKECKGSPKAIGQIIA